MNGRKSGFSRLTRKVPAAFAGSQAGDVALGQTDKIAAVHVDPVRPLGKVPLELRLEDDDAGGDLADLRTGVVRQVVAGSAEIALPALEQPALLTVDRASVGRGGVAGDRRSDIVTQRQGAAPGRHAVVNGLGGAADRLIRMDMHHEPASSAGGPQVTQREIQTTDDIGEHGLIVVDGLDRGEDERLGIGECRLADLGHEPGCDEPVVERNVRALAGGIRGTGHACLLAHVGLSSSVRARNARRSAAISGRRMSWPVS